MFLEAALPGVRGVRSVIGVASAYMAFQAWVSGASTSRIRASRKPSASAWLALGLARFAGVLGIQWVVLGAIAAGPLVVTAIVAFEILGHR